MNLTSFALGFALLGGSCLGLVACSGDSQTVPENSPVRNRTKDQTAPPAKTEEAPIPPPTEPLATAATEWPGIEARLMKCSPAGNLLVVEVQLFNTSAAPVTIENYSATEATAVDDKQKIALGVFQPPGRQAGATNGLTQTVEPGGFAAVSATFPHVPGSERVTLTFPKMALFTAVPITAGAKKADQEARDKNTNKAASPAPPSGKPAKGN